MEGDEAVAQRPGLHRVIQDHPLGEHQGRDVLEQPQMNDEQRMETLGRENKEDDREG